MRRINNNAMKCGTNFRFPFKWDAGHDVLAAMWMGGTVKHINAADYNLPRVQCGLLAQAAVFSVMRREKYWLLKVLNKNKESLWFEFRKGSKGSVVCSLVSCTHYIREEPEVIFRLPNRSVLAQMVEW